MHYMVCISGFSGSGKDECAAPLVKNHFAVQTGLADPGKRHMADAYGFTEQQLFGPSAFRNAGDVRIPKNDFYKYGLKKWIGPLPEGYIDNKDKELDPEKVYWSALVHFRGQKRMFVPEGAPEFWLSPREALQQYMEKMNQLDVYTWIRKGIEDQLLLATGNWGYSRMRGLVRADDEGFTSTRMLGTKNKNPITCFADFRHIPEVQYVRELAARSLVPFTPVLIRVKRPSVPVPPFDHRSETEQVKIRDAAFDAIVHNDKDIPHLHAQIEAVLQRAMSDNIPSNPWREEYIIADRRPEEGYAP